MDAIGYVRTSRDEQLAELDVQEEVITAAAVARGWDLVDVVREQVSGATIDRPGLAGALRRLDEGHADALIVSRLDRLTGSLAQLGTLLETAHRSHWVLVALDVGVDLSIPSGDMVAGILGATAVYERRLISARTREALAIRRAAGVRLGGPRRCPDDVLERVVQARATGSRLIDIADELNGDGVPTPGGGVRWYASHVSRLLNSQDGRTALDRYFATHPRPRWGPYSAAAEAYRSA